MNEYRIDSHKLMYHIKRVNDWLDFKTIYPIYAEISPSGACNHRCTCCALDFMEYQPKFLDVDILKTRLYEMASLGVKSVMYAGEGEPLLHKDIGEIINYTKIVGLDCALTTNGVLLKRNLADKILPSLTWIKVSINGATKETYSKIHQTKKEDFDRVIENLTDVNKIRKENGYKCTLGAQIILLPENYREVHLLAQKMKEIGMDYLVVKPYSQHSFSKTNKYRNIKYNDNIYIRDELQDLNDDKFKVIFRLNIMKKWDEKKRNYKQCLALPFWSYIDSSGNVWGCSSYLTDEQFKYGNIYNNTFDEIWNGNKRFLSLTYVENELNVNQCRVNCRMDEINRYLWELKHPSGHTNFI